MIMGLKKGYKIIMAAILVVSILSCNSNVAALAKVLEVSETNSYRIGGGVLYTCKTDESCVSLIIPDDDSKVELCFVSSDYPNKVFQFYMNKAAFLESFLKKQDPEWAIIRGFCLNNLAAAKCIEITVEDVTYENPIDITATKSSVAADLTDDLISVHGNEYSGIQVYQETYQGQLIKVYQRMDYHIYSAGYKNWNSGGTWLTLGSFITGVMNLTTTSEVLNAFSIIFGVAAVVNALVPGSGRVDKYQCDAVIGRYTSINGSAYPYTMTLEIYDYMGYDDHNLNSTERAAIDFSSQTRYWGDGANYYYNCSAQVADAYDVFLQIGQMD